MTGSCSDYDALAAAYLNHKMAEAEFDAEPSALRAKAADQIYIAMVSAACRIDPHALRFPSISAWVQTRVATYRRCCANGFQQSTEGKAA